jgi:GNAT superfamily N-acetyltransferase
MGAEIVPYGPSLRRRLVAFLNEAYADLRALHAVGVEGADYPEFTEEGQATRDARGMRTFVGLAGSEIISAASCDPPNEDGIALVRSVGTAPAHRRQGHASALLGRCEAFAESAGAKALRTGPFVDSRYKPACGLFARRGYHILGLDRSNMTMEIDLGRWEPREPQLPPGYRLVTFRPGDEQAWCAVKNAVFGGEVTPEWFRGRFGDQPNFDPEGWFFIEHEGRKVGIAGAIVWFADAQLTRANGALMEWVGVLDEERGKGLGEALVVACLMYLKRRNVYPNCVVSQYFRTAAVALYEKMGYGVIRECRTYEKLLG